MWQCHVTGPIVLGSCLKYLWLHHVEVFSDGHDEPAGAALYAEHGGRIGT